MDVKDFLKEYLNSQGQIKNKDLQKIIPKLKSIIDQKTKDRKIKKEDMRNILQESLSEMGWNKDQISKLSQISKNRIKVKKKTSPSFSNKHVIKPKIYQGGSPGLGKKK